MINDNAKPEREGFALFYFLYFCYLCPKITAMFLDKDKIDYKKRFEKIYSNNLRNVEFYARSYVKDEEISRSVAHDSFLVLWEKRMEIDYNGEVLPYLFAITKNKCLNILKREKCRNKFVSYTAYKENIINQEAIFHSTSVTLYEKEVHNLINKAIGSMPIKVKDTFLLSHTAGLKNKEVAQQQNVAISTVEYRLAQAYVILKKRLKDYLPIFLGFLSPMFILFK